MIEGLNTVGQKEKKELLLNIFTLLLSLMQFNSHFVCLKLNRPLHSLSPIHSTEMLMSFSGTWKFAILLKMTLLDTVYVRSCGTITYKYCSKPWNHTFPFFST